MREADAARQLAEGFSEEQEWDLIEVVMNQTIEGKGKFEDSHYYWSPAYIPCIYPVIYTLFS